MNYLLDASPWYITLCVLIGALGAVILYRREKQLEESPSWLKPSLAIFRFLSLTLICVLLLGILIEDKVEKQEKPIIVVGHDNSISLTLNSDSTYYKELHQRNYHQFIDRLEKKFEVYSFTFGDSVRQSTTLTYDEKLTNTAAFFQEVVTRFQNRNIGAVIAFSDGIFNVGSDPSYPAANIRQTPIYTVALGDTSVVRDISLEDVNHNDIAFLGNDFPVEIMVAANRFQGEETNVRIEHNGQTIASKKISFDHSADLSQLSFRIEADAPGMQKYTVIAEPLEGEFTRENNVQTIYVEVQNNKQQVLILAHAPHPDIGALRHAIQINQSYKVEVKMVDEFDGSLNAYSLIILHQLPDNSNASQKWITQVQNLNKPVLFVLGSEMNYGRFNALKSGLSHIGFSGLMDPRRAGINSGFDLFKLTDDMKQKASHLPILHVPFGTFKISNSVQSVYNQVIVQGTSGTDPLIAFNEWNGVKIGFIAGEGIWRWRLSFPKMTEELIQKMIQFLAAKEDKSYFRLLGKKKFNENESVTFEAEVFNESYELITTPEVSIEITNEEGVKLPKYEFTPSGNGYQLNLGTLPEGRYSYIARTSVSGKNYELRGDFTVTPVRLEYSNSVANHQVLRNISSSSGGDMFDKTDLDALYDAISAREDIRPIIYEQSSFDDLINWKWIFFLLVLWLSVEWFLRKRYGAY